MSRSRSDYLEGHVPTNGSAAKYLLAEYPDTPATKISERFKYWEKHGCLPEHAADYPCPSCGGSLVVTDLKAAFECEDCGQVVFEPGDAE